MASLAYEICRREVSKAGSSDPVAKKLGYARSSLNLYLLGRYPAKSTENIEKKILATYTSKILCPFTNKIIEQKECDEIVSQNINTGNPVLFKLQQFCKTCPERLKNNRKEEFKRKFEGETLC